MCLLLAQSGSAAVASERAGAASDGHLCFAQARPTRPERSQGAILRSYLCSPVQWTVVIEHSKGARAEAFLWTTSSGLLVLEALLSVHWCAVLVGARCTPEWLHRSWEGDSSLLVRAPVPAPLIQSLCLPMPAHVDSLCMPCGRTPYEIQLLGAQAAPPTPGLSLTSSPSLSSCQPLCFWRDTTSGLTLLPCSPCGIVAPGCGSGSRGDS